MFVYSKFGRFAIFGFVRLNYPKQWVGSKVKLRGGFLKPRQYVLPTQFGEFLADRANRVWEIMSGISDAQQKNINDTIRSDLDGFANSDMFRAIQFDVDAFGHAALRK